MTQRPFLLIEAGTPDARTACLRALLALPVAPEVLECHNSRQQGIENAAQSLSHSILTSRSVSDLPRSTATNIAEKQPQSRGACGQHMTSTT